MNNENLYEKLRTLELQKNNLSKEVTTKEVEDYTYFYLYNQENKVNKFTKTVYSFKDYRNRKNLTKKLKDGLLVEYSNLPIEEQVEKLQLKVNIYTDIVNKKKETKNAKDVYDAKVKGLILVIISIIVLINQYLPDEHKLKTQSYSDSYSSYSSSSYREAKIVNSGYDSSVWQVEDYLEENLKDPDSYEGIDWSPVEKTDDGNYMVRHKYRAKNSLGGYVVENKIFLLNKYGKVILTKQYR